jgi:UPF0755 protein
MKFGRTFWKAAACAVLVLSVGAAIAAAGAWWWLRQPLSLAADVVEVSIEPNTSPRDIAQTWMQAGVQAPPLALYQWFRWSGQSRKIRAGSYEVGRGVTPIELLNTMVRGNEALTTVRLIEGWTFRQFRAELAKAEALKPTTINMSDAQIMQALGAVSGAAAAGSASVSMVASVSPEGWFYPDTYAYSKGTTDLAVLKRAHRAMQKRLEAAWKERAPDSPLRSATDALVLASIVEKETAASADRGLVAGVFVNRLRINMPLQTDPTVIYGLGTSFDGNLRKRDLQTDTPYNTYTRRGLPPTPIAMPGKAALLAAVKPEATKALYFVARGDGRSEFSETLADHNRAVNQYVRGR